MIAFILIGVAIALAICLLALHVSNNWQRWKFFKGRKKPWG